jgi:hypothetical protein
VDAEFPSAGLTYLQEDLTLESLEPCQPDLLYIFRFQGGDAILDIGGAIDLKIAALK